MSARQGWTGTSADPTINHGEPIMRLVGYLATGLAGACALAALWLAIESLPDIRRYIRLSNI
jgi:hypothetical protein